MEIEQEIITQVKVEYTIIDGDYTYQDIIYFTPKEFKELSKDDIEKIEVDSFNSWKVHMLTPMAQATNEEKLVKLTSEKEAIERRISLLSIKNG